MKRVLVDVNEPNYSENPDTGSITIRPRPKLLERQPPNKGRVAAFNEIHEKLAVATEFYQNHGDGGQYGVSRAINDIYDYFNDCGIPYAALEPIKAVAAAIVDAKDGVESPIFRPNRTVPEGKKGGSGRPRKAIEQLENEGYLAVIIECCILHCKEQKMRPFIKPAADQAAKLINTSNWPIKVTARELIELRERVQQTSNSSADRILLNELMNSEIAKKFPIDWANILLKHEWVNHRPELSE